MYVIDQAHWLATQEILILARREPSASKQDRERRYSAPIDWDASRPATVTSHDSSLSALERDQGFKLNEVGDDAWSNSEGPIVETPMGLVRPWPRRSGRREDDLGSSTTKYGSDGPGTLTGVGGLPWDGVKELSIEPRKPSTEYRKKSLNDSDWGALGIEFSESPIIKTPIGAVRPTGMRCRLNSDKKEGRVDTIIPYGERPREHGDVGTRSEEKASFEGPKNVSNENDTGSGEERTIRAPTDDLRTMKWRPEKPWTERNGHAMISPAWPTEVNTEKEADLLKFSTTKTPAEELLLEKNRKGRISAVFQDMVESSSLIAAKPRTRLLKQTLVTNHHPQYPKPKQPPRSPLRLTTSLTSPPPRSLPNM